MHLAAYQIILITIYAFIAINDSLISNTLTQPAIAGMISGMIMGDLKTGLMVGGTLQLWYWFSCSCFSVDVATRCSGPFL